MPDHTDDDGASEVTSDDDADSTTETGNAAPDRDASETTDDDLESVAPEGDERTRRWLLRAVVAVTIGIPVAVEVTTLLGMLKGGLFGGDGGGDAATTTTTTTETTTVDPGAELLPATPNRETVRRSVVRVVGEQWRYLTTVEVENAGDVPYELRLTGVTLADGTRIDGTATTGTLDPGERTVLRGWWGLPEGERPETLAVVGVTHGENGRERTVREAPLGDVPVKWSSTDDE